MVSPTSWVSEILDGSNAYQTEIAANNPKRTHMDGFASIRLPDGTPPIVQDPTQIKYRVKFETTGAFGSILLSTPVLDDVTIYFDDEQTHLLSYVFESRAY